MASKIPTSIAFEFMNDEDIHVTQAASETVPDISPILLKNEIAYSTSNVAIWPLCMLAAMRKNPANIDIMRILASVSNHYRKNYEINFLGGRTPPTKLNLDAIKTAAATTPTASTDGTEEEDNALTAEFDMGLTSISVSIADVLAEMRAEFEDQEVSFYFGILFLAGVKKAETKNITAFNDNRVKQLANFLNEDNLKIFVSDSTLLSVDSLRAVNQAFNSYQPHRKHLVDKNLSCMQKNLNSFAEERMFDIALLLLANQQMTALVVIKEAAIRHPWIAATFTSLKSDFAQVQKALTKIQRAPEYRRPFLKAIYGSDYVPVRTSDVNNLLGICKEALIPLNKSYENYQGGTITDEQSKIVQQHLAMQYEDFKKSSDSGTEKDDETEELQE